MKGKRGNLLKEIRIYFLFWGGSDGKESVCNVGDTGSIPGSGRSPGRGNVNPLHYYCLENPMDRGTWQATVHRVTQSQTRLIMRAYLSVCMYVCLWDVVCVCVCVCVGKRTKHI